MAAGIIAGVEAALPIIEPLMEKAYAALEPSIAAAIKNLPSQMAGAVTPVGNNTGVGVEVSVAANLSRAIPYLNASTYKAIETKIGLAVAEYVTSNPKVDLNSDAAWAGVCTLASEGVDALRIDLKLIGVNDWRQMVASGISMFMAGNGTRAISVTAP